MGIPRGRGRSVRDDGPYQITQPGLECKLFPKRSVIINDGFLVFLLNIFFHCMGNVEGGEDFGAVRVARDAARLQKEGARQKQRKTNDTKNNTVLSWGRGSGGVQSTGVSQSVRETSRDESQNVLSTEKLFKTRDLELPIF